jgi:hypothetical protein
MSNEQPPPDDDQGDTFGRIADELNRRGVPIDTPTGRLAAQMIDLFEKFEQERRAEIIAAGGTPEDADDGWGDTLSRSNLVSVARAHRNATRPHRTEQGDLDRLLDDLADEFSLTDVRIVRGVAAALADAMPRIAHKHREQGMSPDEIARKTGYTASRIAQFIRQEKERRAAPGTLRRYTWRIDVLDADDGRYGWTSRETGEDDATPADLPRLAERLLAETGARDQRARIVMWEGDEGADADAVHTAERGTTPTETEPPTRNERPADRVAFDFGDSLHVMDVDAHGVHDPDSVEVLPMNGTRDDTLAAAGYRIVSDWTQQGDAEGATVERNE